MLPGNQIPPPSKLSNSLGILFGRGTGGSSETSGSNAQSRRSVSERAASEGAANKPPGFTGTKKDAQVTDEKGTEDAAASEKAVSHTAKLEETLNVPADLKTEAGSQYGDMEDPSLGLPGDQDMVTLPVHSQLHLGSQGSVKERRRELAQLMAEHLVQAALLAGSRNNITVMVALLPGCGVWLFSQLVDRVKNPPLRQSSTHKSSSCWRSFMKF